MGIVKSVLIIVASVAAIDWLMNGKDSCIVARVNEIKNVVKK